MPLNRRHALGLMAGATLAMPSIVRAQAWPTRPITLIVPFAAGGGTDAFARPLAAQLDGVLGQRIIIENRAGAGGTVGASAAAKATPDGSTFFVGAAHHTIAPSLYPNLDYVLERDFIPLAMIARPPQVIVSHPTRVQAKTLAELIAFARANPGKLNYGSAGSGTTHHLVGELFKLATGTDLQHVPYRGAGPAMQDLVAGQIDLMFDGLGSSAPQIQSGTLRGLAVAAAKRSPAIPDVPTTAEAGLPDFEASTWYGIWAIKGTPEAASESMLNGIRKVLGSSTTAETWARNGSDVPSIERDAFARHINAEIARWAKVVRGAKVTI